MSFPSEPTILLVIFPCQPTAPLGPTKSFRDFSHSYFRTCLFYAGSPCMFYYSDWSFLYDHLVSPT